jgi:hypothetical protein
VKILFSIFIILINLNSTEILVSKKNINYKQLLDINNLELVNISNDIRCTTFDKDLLKSNKYQAKRFIYKGKSICYKDVQKIIINKVKADFGNIEIQRNGKVISENKDYVKIKSYDGKIIKIYKNGQK